MNRQSLCVRMLLNCGLTLVNRWRRFENVLYPCRYSTPDRQPRRRLPDALDSSSVKGNLIYFFLIFQLFNLVFVFFLLINWFEVWLTSWTFISIDGEEYVCMNYINTFSKYTYAILSLVSNSWFCFKNNWHYLENFGNFWKFQIMNLVWKTTSTHRLRNDPQQVLIIFRYVLSTSLESP